MGDVAVFKKVVGLLNKWGSPYWLARGRFHHYEVSGGEFGDHCSDIDFHVHEKDVPSLITLLTKRRYEVRVQPHKVFTCVAGKLVEFMILKPDPDRDGFLYHETQVPEYTRPSCPASAFEERWVEIRGVKVQVPQVEYLEYVFGADWRTYRKDLGD